MSEFHDMTAHEIAAGVKGRRFTAEAVIAHFTARISRLDPGLHAFLSTNPHAVAEAKEIDRRIAAGEDTGPLSGVPVAVKDNIDVAGMPTTAACPAYAHTPAESAPAVARLVAAGALILGKTNMPDFALDGVNTLSSFGGQTVNPYNLTLTVYGSSGGSAAAVAADLGVIGLGSDTFGSLVQPASATGLVAIRPTQGLVPARGILPLMTLQDSAGPMTRTVEDAAATLELLVDAAQAGKGSQAYTQALGPDGLRGLKLGYDPLLLQPLPMPPLVPSPEVSALFDRSLEVLTQGGAVPRPVSALPVLLPALQGATDRSFQCMPADFKQGIAEYLATLGPGAPRKTLGDLIGSGGYLETAGAFLKAAEATTETRGGAACTGYLAAKAAAADAIEAFLDKEGLDLLIYPAANQPPFAAGSPPPPGWYGFQVLSSPTGLPSLSMPMGVAASSGAPVGLIFLGRRYQEAKLVQAAYGFQQRRGPRPGPAL